MISFEIKRNMIIEKRKSLKSTNSSTNQIKENIETLLSAYIINSEKNSLHPSSKNLEPSYSLHSPKLIKPNKRHRATVSEVSTLPSVNYFKSPEGIDLSFVFPTYAKSPSIKKISSSHSRTSRVQPPEESPIISLVPYHGKKVKLRPVIRSSCFAQIEKLQELKELSDKQFSDEYHQIKTKDFDVYGSARKSMPIVQALRSISPVSRINSKYLMSETLTDNRVRTISQTKQPLFKVPNTQAVRRSSNISIFKSSILSDYISDPNRRVLEITPNTIEFGNLINGRVCSQKILLKNEDSLMVRFNIKQSSNPDIKVIYRPGPIAPGMTSKAIVEISSRDLGEINSTFEVYCKSEIYTIPVHGNVTSEESTTTIKSEKIKGLVEKIRGSKLPSLNKAAIV